MLAALASLSLPSSSTAAAAVHTANWLLQTCDRQDVASQSYCLGYVSASVEAMSILLATQDRTFCMPDTITQYQLQEAVILHIKKRPKDWHESAAVLIGLAVLDAWPCTDRGFND